ncbi:MAG: maleylpyruvate isomerase N-terminal domain-containing protein [Acidimicrobiia bacterium]
MADSLLPDDIVEAANHVAATLAPATDADWSVPAGRLDWDVRTTVLHSASAVTYYSGHLASQTTTWLPLILDMAIDATNEQVLRLLPATARMLAIVAAGSPGTARAYHEGGMADVSGFLAMAVDEVIVHGADAAAGLGLAYDPPEPLARKVLDRLFPWAPRDTPTWLTLLWSNGRASLPGQPDRPQNWGWQCAPLDEWDGEIRVFRRPPVSFELDTETNSWRGVR